MPKHHSNSLLKEFGKHEDLFEIIDLNTNDLEARKNFANMIKRCEDIENKIGAFYDFCNRFNISPTLFTDYRGFLDELNKIDIRESKAINTVTIDNIENQVLSDEKTFKELYNNYNYIMSDIDILKERKAVYSKLFTLFGSSSNFNKMDLNNRM